MKVVTINDNVFKDEFYVSPVVTVIKFAFEGILCQSQMENDGPMEEEEGQW